MTWRLWGWLFFWGFVLLTVLSSLCQADSSTSLQGYSIHLYDVTYGFSLESDPSQITCAPSGTEVFVVSDPGTGILIVSVDELGKRALVKNAWCGNTEVEAGNLYTITKTALVGGRYTSKSLVTGILSVPFKWHLSDKSVTVGSTIGGYIGYQTSIFNTFTITPILGGGLAMTSEAVVGSAQGGTRTGVSLATGFIGSIGPGPSGVQWGVILGMDWLGRNAVYRYEGKPWIALEIGYKFGL